MNNTNNKKYLGDSVYATFDGYHIVLTTENGFIDDPKNKIALEPEVIENLYAYQRWIIQQIKIDQLTLTDTSNSNLHKIT